MQLTKSDRTGLTEKQRKALPFLLAARSEGEGCRLAKISRQTYYDWLKEPQFKAELCHLRNLIVDDAIETLKTHATKAVDVLVSLLDTENATLQRNVANDILAHIAHFRELHELEKRLTALEAK